MSLDRRNFLRKTAAGVASSLFLSGRLPVKDTPAMLHESYKPVCGNGAHAKSRAQCLKDQPVSF